MSIPAWISRSSLNLARIFLPPVNRKSLSSLSNLPSYSIRDEDRLDKLCKELTAQRFKNIVVIDTKLTHPKFMIIATAFSQRHLTSGTEQINKYFKSDIREETEEFARLGISQDWNVIDLNDIMVHLFCKDCREHFDIEQLWAVGEEYDSLVKSTPAERRRVQSED